MELVERYLQAIEFWLPSPQKHDITAELSEEIQAQVEERAAALGRELDEGEVEALLKQFGSPLLVANRYLPQESLIGPMLFPVYRLVLKIVALCFVVPWVVVWAVMLVYGNGAGHGASLWASAAHLLGSLSFTGFVSLGMVTVVFAVLERTQTRSLVEEWNPRKLPAVRDPHAIPRLNSALELGGCLFGAVWWAGNMASPMVWYAFRLQISLSPVWAYFYWGFLGLAGCGAALAAVNLTRPYWTGLRAALRLLLDGAQSALFCWLLTAKVVTGVGIAGTSAQRASELAAAVDVWMGRMLPVGVILAVVILWTDGYRIYRATRADAGLRLQQAKAR
jgi:hypothetical protein